MTNIDSLSYDDLVKQYKEDTGKSITNANIAKQFIDELANPPNNIINKTKLHQQFHF